MFFSVNENESAEYTHDKMSLNDLMKSTQDITSLDGKHDGKAGVNYVQTPGFSSFSIDSDHYYNGTTDTHGIYAPKGSYVVSNNTIVHLNKDNPLKGFRGWIIYYGCIRYVRGRARRRKHLRPAKNSAVW